MFTPTRVLDSPGGSSRRTWYPGGTIPKYSTKPAPRTGMRGFGDIELTYIPPVETSSGIQLQFLPETSPSVGLEMPSVVTEILSPTWIASLTKGLELPSAMASPIQINPINQGNSMQSGGALPVLQNVVSGAASVLGSYLNLQAAKSQAGALTRARTTLPQVARTGTTGQVQTAGIATGNLAIFAIIGIGAYLVFRGKGKPTEPTVKEKE